MVHPVPDSGLARSYVISSPEGLAVVDPGSAGSAEAVVAFIRGMPGGGMADVRWIVATHFHIDHIGGIGRLLRSCPEDAKVLLHRKVRDYLGGNTPLPPLKNWLAAFFPTAARCFRYVRRPSHLLFESLAGIPLPGFGNRFRPPFREERISYLGGEGRQRYELDFGGWEAIETPGHTEDSICLYHQGRRELVCGDLILNLETDGVGRLNRFCEDRAQSEESFRFLCQTTRPQAVFPGHGEIIRAEENALLGVKTR